MYKSVVRSVWVEEVGACPMQKTTTDQGDVAITVAQSGKAIGGGTYGNKELETEIYKKGCFSDE